MPTLTHRELTERAAKWLRNSCRVPHYHDADRLISCRCSVVFTERVGGQEIVDAIGYNRAGRRTVVIECKTSLRDFFADQDKKCRRRPELGMGSFRFYLAEPDIIPIDELPDRWGLLILSKGRVSIAKAPTVIHKPNRNAELELLFNDAYKRQNL